MKSVMIPNIFWDGEYWCIFRGENLRKVQSLLSYSDGSVPNLIVEIKETEEVESGIQELFETHDWIHRILVKSGDRLIGVWTRKSNE
ncbi:MAG: hypothetical protein SOW18_01485 [Peptoniphilus sp.]|nr:hypothetical protein [Peptoniphilus sp.]MDY3118191.1 hypothetical protein [Peptoniphilus sp.]